MTAAEIKENNHRHTNKTNTLSGFPRWQQMYDRTITVCAIGL